MSFEVGTVYATGYVETPPGMLNVPVGVVADGECLACAATGLDARHADHTRCPYVEAFHGIGLPGEPLDPFRDPVDREQRDPVQNQPPTGAGEQEPVPGVG